MIKTTEYTFDYKNIEVTNREIGNMIGYTVSVIPEMVNRRILDVKKDIGNYCRIRGGFSLFKNIQVRDNLLIFEGKTFHTDNIIAGSLKQADSIAVFVCTAGEELSNWVKQLFNSEDPVKAYIGDIAASLIVEKATDQLQYLIEELVLEDQKRITNRYSPGYCGWDVSEQHQLFALLPDNFCGVNLNETALMNPIKSVSGIIGIGQDVRKAAYQCNSCEIKDCFLAYNP